LEFGLTGGTSTARSPRSCRITDPPITCAVRLKGFFEKIPLRRQTAKGTLAVPPRQARKAAPVPADSASGSGACYAARSVFRQPRYFSATPQLGQCAMLVLRPKYLLQAGHRQFCHENTRAPAIATKTAPPETHTGIPASASCARSSKKIRGRIIAASGMATRNWFRLRRAKSALNVES
jgi:hypothetical protein